MPVQPATPCPLALSPQSSGQAATQIAGSGADAWLPDSSYWTSGLNPKQAVAPVSVASTPIVLAVTPAVAQGVAGHSFNGVLASRLTATPIRVGLPDPSQSVPAAAALLSLRAGLAGAADEKAALTWAMRSTPAGLPVDPGAAIGQLAAQPGIAMPTTEQAVYAFNAAAGTTAAQALYADPAVGYSLDYPLLTLNDSSEARGLADALVERAAHRRRSGSIAGWPGSAPGRRGRRSCPCRVSTVRGRPIRTRRPLLMSPRSPAPSP